MLQTGRVHWTGGGKGAGEGEGHSCTRTGQAHGNMRTARKLLFYYLTLASYLHHAGLLWPPGVRPSPCDLCFGVSTEDPTHGATHRIDTLHKWTAWLTSAGNVPTWEKKKKTWINIYVHACIYIDLCRQTHKTHSSIGKLFKLIFSSYDSLCAKIFQVSPEVTMVLASHSGASAC